MCLVRCVYCVEAIEAKLKAKQTPRKKTAEELRREHEEETARAYQAELERFRLATKAALEAKAERTTLVLLHLKLMEGPAAIASVQPHTLTLLFLPFAG